MKKTLGILGLVLVVLLSACGRAVSSLAVSEGPGPGASSLPVQSASAGQAAGAQRRLADAFLQQVMDGNFYFRYTLYLESGGVPLETEMELAANGENQALALEFMGQQIRCITLDGKAYLVNDTLKMVMEMGADGVQGVIGEEYTPPDFEDLSYVGAGTGEIQGETLPYEEYSADETVMRFYFEGDDLTFIEINAKDGAGNNRSAVMEVLEISGDAPAALFEIPESYTRVEYIPYT